MIGTFDPFRDLDKRTRLALRQAFQSGSGAAPAHVVEKLERRGLATRSGHVHEPTEWGKVVRSWPGFWLTEEGKKVALEIVDTLRVSPAHAKKSPRQLDAEITHALAARPEAAPLEDLERKLSDEIRALPMGPARVSPEAEWLNLAWRVVRVARGHERAQRGSSRGKAAQIAARIADGETVAVDELRKIVLPASQREFLAKGLK